MQNEQEMTQDPSSPDYNSFSDIKGLGEREIKLLAASRVFELRKLCKSNAAELTAKMVRLNAQLKLFDQCPSVETVAGWIEQSKAIDPLTVAHQELQARLGSAGQVYSLDQWKEHITEFAPPSKGEMLFIVDQTIRIIEQMYVHLGMKRARRAIDPGQALRLLRQRITDQMDHKAFHSEMLQILHSLGDIHTAYRLPQPYRHAVAFQPFLLAPCVDREAPDGDTEKVRYIVTKTLWEPSEHIPLKPGDEIISWNGVPIAEAVKYHGQQVEGSNPAASQNFGLLYMTMRWLGQSYQPHSPWVIWSYQNEFGETREIRLEWRIILLNAGEDQGFMTRAQYLWFMFNPTQGDMPHDGAMNPASQIGRATTMAIFAPHKNASGEEREHSRAMRMEYADIASRGGRRRAFREQTKSKRVPGSQQDVKFEVESLMAGTFEAEIIAHQGMQYGYIRIRAFPFAGKDETENTHTHFVTEFRRLLSEMPENGLIIDVRGNPGGSTKNAEMLFQFLTPMDIEPLLFQFLATPLTRDITAKPANQLVFGKWRDSVDLAVRTGAIFSQGHPISNEEEINYWGQEYFAPVVLLTSATSYSAADFFSASFQDHEIGQIIGVDDTTGGGGANVWFYREHLLNFLPDDEAVADDEDWPKNINLQYAARLVQRIRKNRGLPIEEIGVRTPPEGRYQMTRRDVLESDNDLLHFAMKTLSIQPTFDLDVFDERTEDGKMCVRVSTLHIDWVDLVIDERVLDSRDVVIDRSTRRGEDLVFQLPDDISNEDVIEIHGFVRQGKRSKRVARYKHRLADGTIGIS